MTTRRDALAAVAGMALLAGAPGPARAADAGTAPRRRHVGPIAQHGYVVTDAAKTAAEWAERVGVGPFYLSEQDIGQYVYRGKATHLRMINAVSYWNDIQIELIQQVSREETLYSAALRTAPNKLNHYATIVPDIDSAVRSLGAEKFVVHRGNTGPDLEFVYLENYLPDGSHLELLRTSAQHQAAFERMKAICSAWDGTRPVRTIADLVADMGAAKS